jgi:UDP-N-acetylglucosamine transferase subunit ALG13
MTEDFDSLKNAWNVITKADSVKGYSADELRKIVKRKSNNEVEKIRRKIIVEWSLAIALSIILVFVIHFINAPDTKWALLFVGIILALSFIPYIRVIRLKLSNQPNLKTYLNIFIFTMSALIKKYIRMAAFIIPLAGLGGFLLGFHSASSPQEWLELFTPLNLFFLALFIAFISVGGFWLQKKYFKWMYGKNMERLQSCLSDLDEVDEATK